MKKVRFLVCLLAMFLLLSGCSSDKTEKDAASADPDADALVIEGKEDETDVEADTEKDADTEEKDEKETQEKQTGNVVFVDFELWNSNDMQRQYAVLTGYDEENNEVWTHTTDEYPVAQVDLLQGFGINQGKYYYIEDGVIITRDISTGDIIWKSENTGGAGAFGTFGEDGTLYMCGYFGPDFYAIDKNGKTLCKITEFSSDYWWAFEIQLDGDTAVVAMEGTPSGDIEYITVNLKDYNYKLGDN